MATLALCMIVRDEAESLARAIRSFDGVADEIIVVDTGSKDDTVAVAQSLGARVVHHPWDDDFSAPRNAGFDAATTQWVFALDADERLHPESREELLRIVRTGDAEAYLVTRRDLTAGGIAEMRFVRLAQPSVKSRMVGRIHERIEPPLTDIRPTGIVIEHDGYLGDRNERRLRRNLPLLQKELADRPGQPYMLAELAHTYWLLRDDQWRETLAETFRRVDLEAPRSPAAPLLTLLEILLVTSEDALPHGTTHTIAERLSERWYPSSVPLLVGRTRLAFGRGDLLLAAELGQRAAKLWDENTYDRAISFDPAIVGAEFRLNLGVALAHAGRLEEAEIRFDEAAAEPRFTTMASANAAAVRAALGATTSP